MLVDGKLYLGDEDGDVVILQEGKTKKVLGEINMGSSVYSSPVPNGTLYITSRNQLFALSEAAAKPATTSTVGNLKPPAAKKLRHKKRYRKPPKN